MKIANKISISFFITAVIFITVAASIFYVIAKTNLQDAIFAHLSTTAESRARHIETFLEEHEQTVEVIAAGIIFRELLSASKDKPEYNQKLEIVNSRINDIKEIHREIYKISVLDKNGIIAASTDNASVGSDSSAEGLFLKGKEGLFIGDIHIYKTTGRSGIDIASPVVKKGEFLGVIIIDLKTEDLFKILLDRTGLGETGEIYLVNKDKYMVSPSRFTEGVILEQKVDTVNVEKCRLHEDRKDVPLEEKVSIFPDYRGVNVLGTHECICQMQWCLLAEVDEKEALAPLGKIKGLFVIVAFSLPVIAWLIGIFISTRITRPIDKLRKGTEIIGAGNLDYKVGTGAKDEVGQLSRAFDKMSGDLKKTTTSVDNLNKEIAERKKAEEKAEEALKVKSQFISMVSHELRTPLTAVREGIGIVLDGSAGKINTEQEDFLDTAKRNVDRLARLINDVLDYQRLEAGRMEYEMKENDINELVKEVEKTMRPLVEEKKLDFTTHLGGGLPKIAFDRDKITQVLSNLVNNAIKFTDKGALAISTERAENAVVVSVKDTGIGIKEEDMDKLFQRFSQIAVSKDRKAGTGTGLGLAISKKIVQQHGGKIWVESVFSQGSTFHFTLPLRPFPPPAP